MPGTIDPPATPLLTAALAFHDNGCCVIPARTDGSKAPAVNWRAYMTRRPDRDQVIAWASGPYDGIGLVCGAVSGNLGMLEAEGRAVTDGYLPRVATHMADHGLAELWNRVATGYVEQTPSGGIHWLYRVADGPEHGNTKLARRIVDGAVQVLFETRGEGGFTVVAPSSGRTHPTGRAWQLVNGNPAAIPTITVDERDMLHAVIRLLDDMPATAAPEPGIATDTGERPGDLYNQRETWDSLLGRHGWTKVHRLGPGWAWRRPGKDRGISATTGQRADADRLYVFTTSTQFEAERPYSKFAAYALLEHGGDYSAAARAIRKDDGHPEAASLASLIAPSSGMTVAQQQGNTGDGDEPALDLPVPTWRPIDLTSILDGTYTPEEPSLMPRADGAALLYPGRVHSFHGESESGKSLVAQAEAARLVNDGQDVLYADYEADAASVVARLRELGADSDAIGRHFSYVRPEAHPHRGHELDAWLEILAQSFSLVVLDGVTDALVTSGASTKDNDEIAAWMRTVPRALAAGTGAAVVLVDHVTKDPDNRGRFALGGQAKMNALDGAAYVVEIGEAIGRGMRGYVTLRVAKDRPGAVRPLCGRWRSIDRTQEAARIVVDSADGNGINVTVEAPNSAQGDDSNENANARLTGLMEKVSRILEARREAITRNELLRSYRADGGKAKDVKVDQAVNSLVDDGYVDASTGPRNARMLRSTSAYRQRNDPLSEAYEPPVESLVARSAEPSERLLPTASPLLPGSGERLLPSPAPPEGGGGSSHGRRKRSTASRSPARTEHPCVTCGRPVNLAATRGELKHTTCPDPEGGDQ